jgi:hypothetical protein
VKRDLLPIVLRRRSERFDMHERSKPHRRDLGMSRSMTQTGRRVDDGVVVATSGFKKVTEFDYLLSQLVGLIP